jgi:hypothetical protein
MKLFVKCSSIQLFRGLDDLLPRGVSGIRESLRGLKHDAAFREYQTHLDTVQLLNEMRARLFYSERELRSLLTGIYFGNDTCEHLLSYPRHIMEVQEYCERHKLHFVFVFPPIAEHSMTHAKNTLELLAETAAEVVVNDFGMLQQARGQKKLTISLGRLFNRVQRNAFIDRLEPEDASLEQLHNQQAARMMPEFAQDAVRRFYKEIGVGRFAVENQNFDFSFLQHKPRMNMDIYYPYRYLSSGRACDCAGFADQRRATFPSADCPHICRTIAVHFPDEHHFGMIHRNNAFYTLAKRLEVPAEVSKNPRNRLIYEPML